MNSAEPVIEVEGLTVRYGSNTVLENVGFEVQPGEIFVIMGGSGCGKSTLLKHVIGIETPAEGNIRINGTDTSTLGDSELRKLHMNIGMLFQSSALFGSMTIGENVALPLTEFTGLPPKDIESIVRMKLGMVELAGYDNHYPSELSGGMKKRAGIARAMALDPAMLFLDEPSAGLDPVTSAELDVLIRKLNEGTGATMVIVTHELETIFNISHRVIMLDRDAKGIIAEGDPRVLRTDSEDPRVTDFFNRRVTKNRMKE